MIDGEGNMEQNLTYEKPPPTGHAGAALHVLRDQPGQETGDGTGDWDGGV